MTTQFKPYKDESRRNWGSTLPEEQKLPNESLKLGAILRIADACESIAKNHDQLQRRAEWAESRMRDLQATVDRLNHSNAALRGHLKRTKKERP